MSRAEAARSHRREHRSVSDDDEPTLVLKTYALHVVSRRTGRVTHVEIVDGLTESEIDRLQDALLGSVSRLESVVVRKRRAINLSVN